MCPYEEKITAWLLGDLSPGEQQDVTRHLESCPSCQAAREELSRVLTPLRSGLAKDVDWVIPLNDLSSSESPYVRPSRWAWLWNQPNRILKSAAILTVSFGTFFALINVAHNRSQRIAKEPSGITYVSYLQPKEDPAPPLAPAEELKTEAADNPHPAVAAAAERSLSETAPVVLPEPLPPERKMPSLPRIADAEPAQAAAKKAFSVQKAKPTLATVSPAASAPSADLRYERAKDETVARRSSAELQPKALRLAGEALALTNAVPTNAVPTNAVMPAVKR